MANTKLIDEMRETKSKLSDCFREFNPQNRKEILFSKWTISDLLAHLINWLELDIKHVQAVIEQKKTKWISDVEKLNLMGVKLRKNFDFESQIEEFSVLGDRLANLYAQIPSDQWDKLYINTD